MSVLEFTMNADADTFLSLGTGTDVTGLAGLQIYFDADITRGSMLRVTDTPRMKLLQIQRVTGYIGTDGRMYATSAAAQSLDATKVGVRLVANSSALNLITDLTYKVSGNKLTLPGTKNWSFIPFHTPAVPSTDTTVDLASFAPGPGQTAIGVAELSNVDALSDATAFAKAFLTASADATAAREVINAVADFDFRLDDTRTPIDGSVTLAKLASAISTQVGNLGSPYFVTSTTGVLNADNATNSTAKIARYGTTHYTNAEEPFYGFRFRSDATVNELQVGGGSSIGNAATRIALLTAANNTTLTGTEWTSLDGSGNLIHLGALTVSGTTVVGTNAGSNPFLTVNGAAGQFRTFAFATAGALRWFVRVDNSTESGSDAGSDFQIVSRADDGSAKTTVVSIARATGAITLAGLLSTLASATGTAGFRLPHGAAPTSPTNGDVWTTTAGLFGRINGTTFQYATLAGTETLTGKTVDLASNTLTGTTAQFNTALSDGDFATLAGAETLASKTLTTPVLNGTPTGTGVATAATPSTLALRDANANLTADAFIASETSTATAAGTTTLTIADTQTQVFTGSTTQTVKLPTTSVIAGQSYTIVNQSSGAVSVQSSGANAIVTLNANKVGVFIAVVDTPTTAANWLSVAPTASNVASTSMLRDANSNVFASNYLILPVPVTTAAGTTTLSLASTATQVFTGSTTQTVKLATTGVQQGQQYTIVNQSSGAVTVQSSGANTIATVAAGNIGVFMAFIATPTVAADWKTIFNA